MWRFSEDGAFVERRCLLFEAGAYPDKGVAISREDLQEIAANSTGEIPVKIEHLSESPLDGVLGAVSGLHVVGESLWGVLRQPVETWRVIQIAGARALSVGLDVVNRRLLETSFVCHPRIKSAQVFSADENILPPLLANAGSSGERNSSFVANAGRGGFGGDYSVNCDEGEAEMKSVRRFAEGLMGYLRGFSEQEGGAGADVRCLTLNAPPLNESVTFLSEIGDGSSGGAGDSSGASDSESANFAGARDIGQAGVSAGANGSAVGRGGEGEASAQFLALRTFEAERRIGDWKREGRIRATETTERLAKTLLLAGAEQIVTFDGESAPVSQMFIRFVEANGETVPMGERIPAEMPGKAGERLIALTEERMKREGIGYVDAFAAVTAAHPELAMAARE